MLEVTGNIWDFHAKGEWITITTNGDVNSQLKAVMGRGVALQMAERFPGFPRRFGGLLHRFGNKVFDFPDLRVITFPVKHHWYESADPALIEQSCVQLLESRLIESRLRAIFLMEGQDRVYMTRPGCANGRLDWEIDVKPILQKYLSDAFIIVQLPA